MALAAHTDTTYFTDAAGLQAFHLLSHHFGDGGASLLVDGFRAAEILRQESPNYYETLCHFKMRAHASGNEGIHIMPDRPFPVLSVQKTGRGKETKLIQVRWNNDDRATLPPGNPAEVAEFYAAARKWVEIIRRPDSEYWEQLSPGRPISGLSRFFNLMGWNAHAIKSSTIGGCYTEGQPSLATGECVVATVSNKAFHGSFLSCGFQSVKLINAHKVNMDDFLSRWKTLNFPKDQLSNSIWVLS